ncbi:hypothetical protein HS99_0006175 [Kitasatospora aureofaciens]|uniref:IPT/TIG domain-containing protein n=1 Tax=Kitasatospora aureofaciens TaxID=1894 RepID=A0A1E7N9U0_KITAU|nr:hypothetical protein HS99_0006175 [Kitasatospora aureofaciens]
MFPDQGPTGGGTPVTIIGTHLTGTTAVHFGNRLATHVVVVDDNEITCVTPAGQGVVNVTVTTPGGTSFPVPFYYIPPPRITALHPSAGPVAGGTTVTIEGRNLQTVTTVTFGTATLVPTVLSDSQITVTTTPAAPGTVPVVVTTVGGVADDATYTYLAPPSATAISPVTGPAAGGTTVTLTGTGLATATNVAFGTTSAAFVVVSDTLINATAPAHTAGAVEVTVATPGGSATAPEPYIYT